jgi:PKD repeat protein
VNDAPWHVDVDWGDSSTHTAFDTSSQGGLGTKSHTYADNGSYTVRVKVTDKNGGYDSKTFTVSVSNVAPIITAPSDKTANEGQSYTFGLGSFTDPGADSPWQVKVNWGDGSAEQTLTPATATGSLGMSPHAYGDNGLYTVTVTVTDKDGASDVRTYKVTVSNVAPTATLGNSGAIDEGGTATISFTSPSDVTADATAGFHYEFKCDGSAFGSPASYTSAGTSSSTTCSFPDNGTKAVRGRIIDKDGGASEYTTNVVVNNVAPVVTPPADQTGTEGTSGSFDLGSFTDANPNDGPWPVSVDWGDTSAPTTFSKTATGAIDTKSHTYADNGAYTVAVSVTDKDGGKSTKTFKVTVANVAPKITSFTGTDYLVGANAFITGGSPLSRFTTNFSDPGADTWKADFTYQDGLPSSETIGTFTAAGSFGSGRQNTHVFAGTVGCKTASVKVTDKDGGFDTATTTIHVGSGAFQPPMTNQPVTDKLKNGQTLPVKVHITDCSGAGALGLNPAIRLVAGDSTPQNDDGSTTITPSSVSAADTTGIMRGQGGGDYMYNMAVNLPKLNADYTVVIYPYGTSSPVQLGHVIQATK